MDPQEPQMLFEYDAEMQPVEENRTSRIIKLKEAIQGGQYDVDGEWARLMQGMEKRMRGGDDD